MATFKAEVYAHQKREDGTYNIKIRVTHNRRKKYLATMWFVGKEDLTRSLKLKNQRYIDLTEDLIRKYRQRCNEIGEALKDMDVEQVVEAITKDTEERFDLDIVAYGYEVVERLQSQGHGGNAAVYKVAIKNLVKFVGRESVSIKEITRQFLLDWSRWIASQPTCTGGYAQHNYLSSLRALHNMAKKEFNDEDRGLIRIPLSPFAHFDMPKLPPVRKRALTLEQLRAIAKLPYRLIQQPGVNRFNFARDVFLLSFGLIGMNAVDLYHCTDYSDGRITYQRTKTKNRRKDKAEISVRVEPELQALVDKYRDPTGQRVFKFYKLYSSMDTFCASLNKALKIIGNLIGVADLEYYAARHTWATLARNNAGVDKYTVHEALNHVDKELSDTDIYIKRSWEKIDNANRAVFDLCQLDLSMVDEPRKDKQG